MDTHTYSAEGDNSEIILRSDSGELRIWPAAGGIINSWKVKMHNKLWEVIDGYESPEDFIENCEKRGYKGCKLSPFVCRIKNAQYDFSGSTYTIKEGKLGEGALHGLLFRRPFNATLTHATKSSASLGAEIIFTGEDGSYPFKYRLFSIYSLSKNNRLSLTTEVQNLMETPMPIADGWHPYFNLGRKIDELELVISESKKIELDDALIPTGNMVNHAIFTQSAKLGDALLDNCFLLKSPYKGAACQLINREDNIKVSVFAEKNYPYLQVYSHPLRNSVAIENLSAAPDAFNNKMGLIILNGGEKVRFQCSYQISGC